MQKFAIGIFNPGKAPADNGRTVHALKLAAGLIEAGADVKVVFEGEGVGWIPRFVNRTDDSHPFVKHYGYAFDAIREHVVTCNMCCHRFDVFDAMEETGVPILGKDHEHVDIARWALEGYQVINH